MSDDIIERLGDFWPDNPADRKLIADSMREIERLRGAAREALNALDNCIEKDYGHRCNRCDSEIDEGHHVRKALRLALGDT